MALSKEQGSRVQAAILRMLEERRDLTMDGKPEAPALSREVGFDVSAHDRDRLCRQLEKDMAAKTSTAKPKTPDVPAYHLEPIVQIAARRMFDRKMEMPSAADVAQHVGSRHAEYCTEDVVRWAGEEARRRSPELVHAEIVAKRMRETP